VLNPEMTSDADHRCDALANPTRKSCRTKPKAPDCDDLHRASDFPNQVNNVLCFSFIFPARSMSRPPGSTRNEACRVDAIRSWRHPPSDAVRRFDSQTQASDGSLIRPFDPGYPAHRAGGAKRDGLRRGDTAIKISTNIPRS